MLSTKAAGTLWGFLEFTGQYHFAMAMGAALMAAWTLLLIWACFKPLERRMIAPMTVLIILGIFAAEIIAIGNGILALNKALVSICMQVLLTILFSYAFWVSRPADLNATYKKQ